MGAMMTDTMASMGMVMVMMPARMPSVRGMMMPGGVMGFVACRERRARRKQHYSSEEKYAEEFHWSLPMYLISGMLGLAFQFVNEERCLRPKAP